MLLAPAGLGAFPPNERLRVITLATSTTQEHHSPDTRRSLDELAFRLVNERAQEEMSRATIERILDAADLKPPRSVYWLNSHVEDFDTKAKTICQLYVDALRLFQQQGRRVICSDEKTGMQILQRKFPTIRAVPGRPEKREFESIRHGTRCLLTGFCVATGEVVWDLKQTRTALDRVGHLQHVKEHYPHQQGFDRVVDNLNTHWSLEVCRQVARWEGLELNEKELTHGRHRRAWLSDPGHRHVFHFTQREEDEEMRRAGE